MLIVEKEKISIFFLNIFLQDKKEYEIYLAMMTKIVEFCDEKIEKFIKKR